MQIRKRANAQKEQHHAFIVQTASWPQVRNALQKGLLLVRGNAAATTACTNKPVRNHVIFPFFLYCRFSSSVMMLVTFAMVVLEEERNARITRKC